MPFHAPSAFFDLSRCSDPVRRRLATVLVVGLAVLTGCGAGSDPGPDPTRSPAGSSGPAAHRTVAPGWVDAQSDLVRAAFRRGHQASAIRVSPSAAALATSEAARLSQIGSPAMHDPGEADAFEARRRVAYGSSTQEVMCWWDARPGEPIDVPEGRLTWEGAASMPNVTGYGLAARDPWLVVCVELRAPTPAEIPAVRASILTGLNRSRAATGLAALRSDPGLDGVARAARLEPGGPTVDAILRARSGPDDVAVVDIQRSDDSPHRLALTYVNPANRDVDPPRLEPWSAPWVHRVGIDIDPSSGQVTIISVGALRGPARQEVAARLTADVAASLAQRGVALPPREPALDRAAASTVGAMAAAGCGGSDRCLADAERTLPPGVGLTSSVSIIGGLPRPSLPTATVGERRPLVVHAMGLAARLTPAGTLVVALVAR